MRVIQPIAKGNAGGIHRQVAILNQLVHHRSRGIIRPLEALCDFFVVTLESDTSFVHTLQKLSLRLGQRILGQSRVDQAPLKGIQHIGYKGRHIEPATLNSI